MEDIKEIEKQMKELRSKKQKITAKHKWSGQGGIWHTFRNLGKSYYNDKTLNTDAKKAKFKADLQRYMDERL